MSLMQYTARSLQSGRRRGKPWREGPTQVLVLLLSYPLTRTSGIAAPPEHGHFTAGAGLVQTSEGPAYLDVPICTELNSDTNESTSREL